MLLLLLAAAGCVGWGVASVPVVATACVVFSDLVGVAMMLPKTWRDPASETLSTYVLASFSGVLSAIAVGSPDGSLLLYPIYFAVSCAAIAGLLFYRRRALTAFAASA